MLNFKLIVVGIFLDFILGDPYSFPHPVKLMGNLIAFEDKLLRKDGSKNLRLRGFLMAIFNILIVFTSVSLLLFLLKPYKIVYSLVYIYLVYTTIAAKSLDFEASKVRDALKIGLDRARYQLSFIVGRETKNLSEEEIIRATIETVAENTSDGVIAPLFFNMILGPGGAMTYKIVNTMDSMVGYKNEKYIDFGRYPAIIDDIFNYIPARITGVLMCIVGLFFGEDAFKIMIRDRKNHASPNAGYPESAVAGILGIKLGGNSYYSGKLVEKPTMGDKKKEIEINDIEETIRIMYCTEIIFLFICLLVYECII